MIVCCSKFRSVYVCVTGQQWTHAGRVWSTLSTYLESVGGPWTCGMYRVHREICNLSSILTTLIQISQSDF